MTRPSGIDEASYHEGQRQAWRAILDEALRQLEEPAHTPARLAKERQAVVQSLRAIGMKLGYTDWEDTAFLGDVVEKMQGILGGMMTSDLFEDCRTVFMRRGDGPAMRVTASVDGPTTYGGEPVLTLETHVLLLAEVTDFERGEGTGRDSGCAVCHHGDPHLVSCLLDAALTFAGLVTPEDRRKAREPLSRERGMREALGAVARLSGPSGDAKVQTAPGGEPPKKG